MGTEIAQQLPQLEAMCMQLYNAQNAQDRASAEQALRVFGMSTEYVPHCKMILDMSNSPYAQLLAASSLLKLVTEQPMTNNVKLEMRSYFLQYLDSKGSQLEPFVVAILIQLVCRMTKLGWFEDEGFRTIADDGSKFLDRGRKEGSWAHYGLGLRLLGSMVQEANSPTPHWTLTQHRKVAVGFRDSCLLKIFQLSLQALEEVPGSGAGPVLAEPALRLAVGCLGFDFVGTSMDDSVDDLGTIQVPTPWRGLLEQPDTMALFWRCYAAHEPPLSSLALEALVRLASVRRSLFASDATRAAFLARLVEGTVDVLRERRGLSLHANYHEFCRLLGRLKTNYQLSELVALSCYRDWIDLVAEFTMSSLASWQWSSGSVYYLLGLWARLVSSMPYLKGDSPSYLNVHAPRICLAFVTSRLESARGVVRDGLLDDPLDSGEQLQDQLDSLPHLFRFQYEDMAKELSRMADPLIAAYGAAVRSGGSSAAATAELAVLEGQVTWVVHIVGAVIRGRANSPSGGSEAQETLDGELAARAFAVIQATSDSTPGGGGMGRSSNAPPAGPSSAPPSPHTPSRRRLELAVLAFLQAFRKAYVGEAVMHSSRVYARLGEKVGIPDHSAVMAAALARIAANLKTHAAEEDVVDTTLDLFKDLAAGYSSGRLLLKLEAVSFLLTHHTPEYFPFLTSPGSQRARTGFYATLARLLFAEDTTARFAAFVAPQQAALDALGSALRAGNGAAAALRGVASRDAVAGLFRDLRGIAAATATRRTYGLLFDWLYPTHFPAIVACLEAWADDPAVTTPLLKFINELVLNKSQRLVICTYGRAALSSAMPAEPYAGRYKGTWICLSILARTLGGGYVNFGVFELYGDPALADAMDMATRLVLAIPLRDIMAYRKVCKVYFGLMEMLCQGQIKLLASRDTASFAFFVSSLDAGLKSLDVAVSSQSAAATDHLAAYYFAHGPGSAAPDATGQAMAEHLRQRPELLPQLLATLFELVLFEDCSNMWSLSRPMLPLILVNEQVYGQIKAQVVASQPVDRRQHLAACLEKVMVDVHRTLESKNRDKFTQNFTTIRHEYRAKA